MDSQASSNSSSFSKSNFEILRNHRATIYRTVHIKRVHQRTTRFLHTIRCTRKSTATCTANQRCRFCAAKPNSFAPTELQRHTHRSYTVKRILSIFPLRFSNDFFDILSIWRTTSPAETIQIGETFNIDCDATNDHHS